MLHARESANKKRRLTFYWVVKRALAKTHFGRRSNLSLIDQQRLNKIK